MVATRNVALTEPQSRMVDDPFATGRFQNASEVGRAGLRLPEREETELRELRERLMQGIGQALAGDLAAGSCADAIRSAFGGASGNGWRGRQKARWPKLPRGRSRPLGGRLTPTAKT